MLRPAGLLAILPALLLFARPTQAAPAISNLSLRGLHAGGSTVLVIDGQQLLPDPQLTLSVPIADQSVLPGATAQRIEVRVTLDESVATGLHLLRIATQDGFSNAVAIAVDRLPGIPFKNELTELPAALTGSISGNQSLTTTFAGKKGEPLVVEVQARRLGSALNPVIHLYDERGVQLAWQQPSLELDGDARLQTVLPADGLYSLELHDSLYRGGNPGFFRLVIGPVQYADVAFPLAVRHGATSMVGLTAGNLHDAAPTEVKLSPAATDRPANLPPRPQVVGFRPRVLASDLDQVIETAVDGQSQKVAVPVGVSGRISQPGEEDKYLIPVTPGSKLKLEITARRLGSPLDAVLYVRNEHGAQLATSDDRPGTSDPALDFTVQNDLTSVVVVVKDLVDRGGDAFVYHLAIAPADRQDFGLSLDMDRLHIPADGSVLLRVSTTRSGYNGPIQLNLQGLPTGVSVVGNEIPSGATSALLTLSASQGGGRGMISVTGTGTEAAATVQRTALGPPLASSSPLPWLRAETPVAVIPTAPLSIAWRGTVPTEPLIPGTRRQLPLEVTRRGEVKGAVRLALISTQPTPRKKIKENNQDKEVDDVERMLRLEGAPTVAADVNEGVIELIVPTDLARITYDFALRAELLSADGKNVLATATTPAIRSSVLPTSKPLVLFEDQPEFVQQLADANQQVKRSTDEKFSGEAGIQVTPAQPRLPGLEAKIRENPAEGEYRFIRFAWKKSGGSQICLQLGHDGLWGPVDGKPAKFRYHAGSGPEPFGGSVEIQKALPAEWTVVTRDLFADFGEFNLTGLALSPIDGDHALFDHIQLSRSPADFEDVKPKK